MAAQRKKRAMKLPFPVQNVSLDVLELDLRNSRFPRDAQSQTDAFELMLGTAGDDCLALLRDVTRKGQMNSSDIPIVVPKGDKYVVMEGNRRLTCLRLWSDPDLLKLNDDLEDQYLSRVEKLIEESDFEPPEEIRVSIFPTEADAEVWIDRKHAGGAGGVGTVEWGAAMKDRRRARNDPRKTSRAMAFVDLVSREFAEESDVQVALETVRTKRYTMIQRFVDRSVVREKVGLKFDSGIMSFQYGAQESLPIIRTVLSDFAQSKAASGKTWARELDTVDDFREYLNGYSRFLPNYSAAESSTYVNGENQMAGSAGGLSDRASAGNVGRNGLLGQNRDTGVFVSSDDSSTGMVDDRPPRPTRARDYIFRGLVLDKFTLRIQEMVRQTSMLSTVRQNEIVSVMLRVVLDLTTYQFLKSHGKDVPRNLDDRIKTSIKLMDPTASDALGYAENTSPLRKAFHDTTPNGIRLVQYAVHDVNSGRTPAEVITLADRYTPVLEAMNDNMGSCPLR